MWPHLPPDVPGRGSRWVRWRSWVGYVVILGAAFLYGEVRAALAQIEGIDALRQEIRALREWAESKAAEERR